MLYARIGDVAVAVLFAALTATAYAADPVELHVAPDGDDASAGSAEAPLATLEAARDKLRERQGDEVDTAAIVNIHSGFYRRQQAFTLGERDAGSAEAPITYRGVGDGDARLVGGRRIDDFEPVSDADVRDRLPEAARDHVRQVDLAELGIDDLGTLRRRGFTQHNPAALELFFNNEPQTLARWPNRGWTTITEIPDAEGRTIGYAGDRPRRWTDAEDAWLFGYWHHGWADEHLPVESIDTDARRITLGARHNYGFQEDQRFYAYNLLEELDQPGEWYLDRETSILYFWPPDDLEQGEAIVSILNEPLIEIENAAHVRIENLTLEASRGTGVVVRGGEHVTIAGCTLRNLGRHGISVSGGRRHVVRSSDLYHLGERGISLSGGDRQTLTPANHEAVNNHIHHFSRWARTYRAAVQISGVGQRVTDNLIHDAPHMAIGFGGNDHLIARNEIHHVLTQTDDAGALYTGRNWTMRGHLIKHNFIHHSGNQHARHEDVDEDELGPHVTLAPRHAHGTNLVYLDDAASGIIVTGNLLHDGGRSIMIGGGRDNLAQDNLVIGGDMGTWMDGRGLGWASDHIKRGGGWGIWDRLEAVPYDEPPYSDRYPGLADLPDNEPHAPVGNRFARNLYLGVNHAVYFQHDVGDYADLEDNVTLERDIAGSLSDLSADQLRQLARELMASSEAREIDFKPIPLDEIGLQEDEFRPTLP